MSKGRKERGIKFVGELLFLFSFVWCVVASDAASVHKYFLGGILLCGLLLGVLQGMRNVTATALPAKAVSWLVQWIVSWTTDHNTIQRTAQATIGDSLRANEQRRQKGHAEIGRSVRWSALPVSDRSHTAMPAKVVVRLLFVGEYRDLVGTPEMVVELTEDVCVADLVSELRARMDGLSHLPVTPVVTVNMRQARLATTLQDGDLVAFIPLPARL